MTTVELLRHAGTEPGHEARALALADELGADPAPGLLVSSPAEACLQTLAPLAVRCGRPVLREDRLAPVDVPPVADGGDEWVAAAWTGGRALGLVSELVSAHPGVRMVLCSHAAVVPATVALLAGRDGLVLSDVRCRQAGGFTLTFEGDRCIAVVAR